jgi:hypothetical protein
VSFVATVIGSIIVIAANWAWRWVWQKFPALNRVFFPDLNGVWEGVLVSTWVDPKTGQTPAPIPAEVLIRQSVLSISIKQKTGESVSWSTRVIPEAEPEADRYRFWYSYSNKPKAAVSHRSCSHDGVAWLEIALTEDPDELQGQYYTSRRTSGDIVLRRTSHKS